MQKGEQFNFSGDSGGKAVAERPLVPVSSAARGVLHSKVAYHLQSLASPSYAPAASSPSYHPGKGGLSGTPLLVSIAKAKGGDCAETAVAISTADAAEAEAEAAPTLSRAAVIDLIYSKMQSVEKVSLETAQYLMGENVQSQMQSVPSELFYPEDRESQKSAKPYSNIYKNEFKPNNYNNPHSQRNERILNEYVRFNESILNGVSTQIRKVDESENIGPRLVEMMSPKGRTSYSENINGNLLNIPFTGGVRAARVLPTKSTITSDGRLGTLSGGTASAGGLGRDGDLHNFRAPSILDTHEASDAMAAVFGYAPPRLLDDEVEDGQSNNDKCGHYNDRLGSDNAAGGASMSPPSKWFGLAEGFLAREAEEVDDYILSMNPEEIRLKRQFKSDWENALEQKKGDPGTADTIRRPFLKVYNKTTVY